MLRHVGVGEVQQARREPAGPAPDQHLLMRIHTAPPRLLAAEQAQAVVRVPAAMIPPQDRKSTRLNSSHTVISYAVFCLKKKTKPTADIAHGMTEKRS